jgi:hypothetical protein
LFGRKIDKFGIVWQAVFSVGNHNNSMVSSVSRFWCSFTSDGVFNLTQRGGGAS